MKSACRYGRDQPVVYSSSEEPYKCPNDLAEGEFCAFHHPDYYKRHEEEVEKKFLEQLDSGETKFIGYHVPRIDLSNRKFGQDIYFNNAVISLADFSNATFSGVVFSHSRFKNATFSGVRFETAHFENSDFDEASFHEAYLEVAYFSNSHFVDVSFEDASFGEADFSGARLGRSEFSGARFLREAIFKRTLFGQGSVGGDDTRTDFSSSFFSESVDFSNSSFSGVTNFVMASMLDAKFERSTFSDEVYFDGVAFEDADFSATSFSKASFCQAYFRGSYFDNCSFGEVDFTHALFAESTRFYSCTFNNGAKFVRLARSNSLPESYWASPVESDGRGLGLDEDESKQLKCGIDPEVYFINVEFEDPKHVRFDDFDLGSVSFLHSDVSRIDIGEKVCWRKGNKLFDEYKADNEESVNTDDGELSYTYEYVSTVYRRLRENLEAKMRYVEAGSFYVGEMECKRKGFTGKNRLLKWIGRNLSPLAFYKYMSNYGESYTRPIEIVLLLLIAVPIFQTIYQLSCQSPGARLADNFAYVALAFFQVHTNDLWQLLIRLISLLLMGQLFIALRRNFERRSR